MRLVTLTDHSALPFRGNSQWLVVFPNRSRYGSKSIVFRLYRYELTISPREFSTYAFNAFRMQTTHCQLLSAMALTNLFRAKHCSPAQNGSTSRESVLEAVVELMPECVKLVDVNGTLLDINDAGLALVEADGWEDVRNASVYDIVAENHVENFRQFNERVCAGSKERLQFEIVGLKGTRRWMDSTAVPFPLPNGTTVQLAITRDISTEKLREEQLRKARELALAANRAKTDFLANMSHEIRTPMTAILGYADILLGEQGLENAPPDRVDAFCTIKRNGAHLLSLINDILDLSKIESGNLCIEALRVSPAEIVDDVISFMRVRADQKNLSLRANWLGPIPGTIESDPVRLRQILINLVGNAIKFTDEGGVTVRVSLDAPYGRNHMLRFEVVDTGIGMTGEQLEKLYRPFSQADSSTTRRFGGTGLGLAITKRLVEMLGGEIEVQTKLNHGTTFVVTAATGSLDNVTMLHPDSLAFLKKPARPPKRTTTVSEMSPLAGTRVLFAEDGPDNQRLISHLLRKAGAVVDVVENGRLAVEATQRSVKSGNPYHVILMDMQMPVMDGYEATRELRRFSYDLPIIALTAHAMSSDRRKCIDAGCDEYLSKPIDRRELIQKVAEYAMLEAVDDSASHEAISP